MSARRNVRIKYFRRRDISLPTIFSLAGNCGAFTRAIASRLPREIAAGLGNLSFVFDDTDRARPKIARNERELMRRQLHLSAFFAFIPQ